jgi:hypothetical protein
LLIAGQAFAVLSALASGETEPAGWLLPVAIAVIIAIGSTTFITV